ncbi:hypothetical protein JOVITA_54 [Microbacterium phage Jovita]|uniref:hypothetical protein n=1 Tax=Microbacterium phage Jovita TaxID=2985323 RepID=UPI00242CB30D|nr:hypothetical protein QDW43_gp54 [Microbacterium phage Jovita]UYL86358.1 hypothetical protein JOVITA_54 [Microbacterium phage Jovita]
MSTSTSFTEALDAALPLPTAGALPSTRTFGMVTEALESDDIDFVKGELQHSRAHYQALEYMLNGETQIIETILESFDMPADVAPTPTTIEEAVRLTVRIFATEVLMAAYDTAHHVGMPMALTGANLQEALQMLFGGLDFSDPERELTEDDIQALLGKPADDED